jgi:aspartate-semialdehyde dehydrogenase
MKRESVAIVGGESLIGRELRELLPQSGLALAVKLVGVDEDSSTLTEQDGEPTIITPLDEEALRGARIAFLAGSALSSRRARALVQAGTALIDLTYAGEDEPPARLRAPSAEPPGYEPPPGAIHVIAHPAAIALAMLLERASAFQPIRRSLALVFEPASERGRRGIDELQKQTVNLLSFKSLPKEIFDAQLGFNLLARYGSEAPEALETVELRIERHLASLLSLSNRRIPLPSLRLVQAPVFHGYSMSVHLEFEEPPDLGAFARALSCEQIDVRAGDLEPPTNVGIAEQSGIAVGAIATDRNDPRACWLWAVADNLRLMAENAIAVARSLQPARDRDVGA